MDHCASSSGRGPSVAESLFCPMTNKTSTDCMYLYCCFHLRSESSRPLTRHRSIADIGGKRRQIVVPGKAKTKKKHKNVLSSAQRYVVMLKVWLINKAVALKLKWFLEWLLCT